MSKPLPQGTTPPPAATISLQGGDAAISVSDFADTMANVASSVFVVTAADHTRRAGRTVTALLSLGANPPSLLVSVTRNTELARIIADREGFSVSLLAQGQEAIADGFAGLGPLDERFSLGEWASWPSGQPRLAGAVASFDCLLGGTIETNTHLLFAGVIAAAEKSPSATPLVWHKRGYSYLTR